MDGQRRIARPVSNIAVRANPYFRQDIAIAHRRLFRTVALAMLLASVLHGLSLSSDGSGSPMRNWQGRLASMVGLAADKIRLSGIEHHDPKSVLEAIRVRPGGSLLGFDTEVARQQLSKLDWVQSATVERVFPNQLAITLAEREAFAIWQNDGEFGVIDKSGQVMSGVDAASFRGLPLITGAGANTAVADLINQMEATPRLKAKVRAAARVGQRRWNLYLDNGVKIALPEKDIGSALAKAEALDRNQGILSKAITLLDLRVADEVVVALAVSELTVAERTGAAKGQ